MIELFEKMDRLVGDMAPFQGLAFEFDHGTMVVDQLEEQDLYLLTFFPNEGEKIKFAAVGYPELLEQISEYVLE